MTAADLRDRVAEAIRGVLCDPYYGRYDVMAGAAIAIVVADACALIEAKCHGAEWCEWNAAMADLHDSMTRLAGPVDGKGEK